MIFSRWHVFNVRPAAAKKFVDEGITSVEGNYLSLEPGLIVVIVKCRL